MSLSPEDLKKLEDFSKPDEFDRLDIQGTLCKAALEAHKEITELKKKLLEERTTDGIV